MDEKLALPSELEQAKTLETERVTRRTFLMNVGIALNAAVALVIATPVVVYLLGPVLRRKEYLQWITVGNVSDFPVGETKLITFKQSVFGSMGWRDGEGSGICAAFGSGRVYSVCDQLRAPWMSGALVLGVAVVYVSVPWRSVLRRRQSRLGTAGARDCLPMS